MIMLIVRHDENGLPHGLKLTSFTAEKTTKRHFKTIYELSRDLHNSVYSITTGQMSKIYGILGGYFV